MSLLTEKRQRIIIVTHETQFGEDLTNWLRHQGYEVSLFGDGQEALALAKEMVPSLVVLDLYVKEPSGLDVLRSLRDQGFRGKVIVLAGVSVSPLIPEAFHLGIDGVLGHSHERGHLECAIRLAIGPPSQELPASHQDNREVAQS